MVGNHMTSGATMRYSNFRKDERSVDCLFYCEAKMITQERAKELFEYDSDTGVLIRKTGQHAGKVQSCTDNKGYVITYADGESIKAHRLIWIFNYGDIPNGMQIDHINGHKSDNKLSNLRLADRCGNGANKAIYPCKKLKLPKGVKINARGVNKYLSLIYKDNKPTYLGSFFTVDEAAHAYNKAAIAMYGEFACLNPLGIWNDVGLYPDNAKE